jgi:hypothetical protein
VGGGVQLGPFGTAATNTPIVLAPGDYDAEIGGMIGRGNRSTRRKPAPVPLCSLQIPHAARMGTRAVAVGTQRLTAIVNHNQCDVLRPTILFVSNDHKQINVKHPLMQSYLQRLSQQLLICLQISLTKLCAGRR